MKTVYLTITICILAVICAIFALDRVRINAKFNAIGDRIDEKTALIEKNDLEYRKNLELMQAEIDKLNARFSFVTELRVPVLPVFPGKEETNLKKTEKKTPAKIKPLPPFAQILVQDNVVSSTARSLRKEIRKPLPENVRTVFLAYLMKADRPIIGTLVAEPVSGRVIDRDAAILETICRELGLQAQTELRWDMNNLVRSCVTKIASPDPAVPSATVVYGSTAFHNEAPAVQNAPYSTVLAFPSFYAPATGEHQIFMKLHEIPAGGLYVHKFNVVRPGTSRASHWYLEYRLSPAPQPQEEGKQPQPYSLQAFSLISGPVIVAAVSGDRLTFKVPFVNGKSSLIVFGDRVFFPESATATLAEELKNIVPEDEE